MREQLELYRFLDSRSSSTATVACIVRDIFVTHCSIHVDGVTPPAPMTFHRGTYFIDMPALSCKRRENWEGWICNGVWIADPRRRLPAVASREEQVIQVGIGSTTKDQFEESHTKHHGNTRSLATQRNACFARLRPSNSSLCARQESRLASFCLSSYIND